MGFLSAFLQALTETPGSASTTQTAMRRDRLDQQLQAHKRKLAQLQRGDIEDIRNKFNVLELLQEEVNTTVDFIAENEDDFHYQLSFDQLEAGLTKLSGAIDTEQLADVEAQMAVIAFGLGFINGVTIKR